MISILNIADASPVAKKSDVVDLNYKQFTGRIGGLFPHRMKCVPALACDEKSLWIGLNVEGYTDGRLMRTTIKTIAAK